MPLNEGEVYIGRPVQRYLASLLEEAFEETQACVAEKDEMIWHFYDQITKTNGAPATGFATYFNLDTERENDGV